MSARANRTSCAERQQKTPGAGDTRGFPGHKLITFRRLASASCASRADPERRGRWRKAGARRGAEFRYTETGVSVKLSVWTLLNTQSDVQRSNLKPLPTGTARNVKSVKIPNNESVCRRIPFSSMNGNVEKRRLSAPKPTGKPVKLTGYLNKPSGGPKLYERNPVPVMSVISDPLKG